MKVETVIENMTSIFTSEPILAIVLACMLLVGFALYVVVVVAQSFVKVVGKSNG